MQQVIVGVVACNSTLACDVGVPKTGDCAVFCSIVLLYDM